MQRGLRSATSTDQEPPLPLRRSYVQAVKDDEERPAADASADMPPPTSTASRAAPMVTSPSGRSSPDSAQVQREKLAEEDEVAGWEGRLRSAASKKTAKSRWRADKPQPHPHASPASAGGNSDLPAEAPSVSPAAHSSAGVQARARLCQERRKPSAARTRELRVLQ